MATQTTQPTDPQSPQSPPGLKAKGLDSRVLPLRCCSISAMRAFRAGYRTASDINFNLSFDPRIQVRMWPTRIPRYGIPAKFRTGRVIPFRIVPRNPGGVIPLPPNGAPLAPGTYQLVIIDNIESIDDTPEERLYRMEKIMEEISPNAETLTLPEHESSYAKLTDVLGFREETRRSLLQTSGKCRACLLAQRVEPRTDRFTPMQRPKRRRNNATTQPNE